MHLHATALSDYDIRRINSRNRRIRTRVPYVDDQGRSEDPVGSTLRICIQERERVQCPGPQGPV